MESRPTDIQALGVVNTPVAVQIVGAVLVSQGQVVVGGFHLEQELAVCSQYSQRTRPQ